MNGKSLRQSQFQRNDLTVNMLFQNIKWLFELSIQQIWIKFKVCKNKQQHWKNIYIITDRFVLPAGFRLKIKAIRNFPKQLLGNQYNIFSYATCVNTKKQGLADSQLWLQTLRIICAGAKGKSCRNYHMYIKVKQAKGIQRIQGNHE